MAKQRLHCHDCGRRYDPRQPVEGAGLRCIACGGPLAPELPAGGRPKRKDPWKGRTVGGARLRKLLRVRPGLRVYRASHPGMRLPVRVELFPARAAEEQDERMRDLFARAALARELHSPHVVAVLDLGRRRDCWYIMTELRPSSLRRELEKRGRLGPRRTLAVAEDVLHGLAAIHEAGSLHGNVTPDGILLNYDGAAQLDHPAPPPSGEDLSRRTLTEGGMLTGPALYAAPELAAEGSEPDRRADLYSLGATMREALTGRAPVPGAPEELPEQLGAWLERLTAEEPDERPQTASQALSELGELALELSRAGKIGPVRAAATPSERRLTAVKWATGWGLAAVALLVLALIPVGMLWQQRKQKRALRHEAEAAAPHRVLLVVHAAEPLQQDPIGAERRLAVRAALRHALACYAEFEPTDPHWSDALRGAGGGVDEAMEAAGARHLLAAAHAPGFRRRRWTLTFASSGRTRWSMGSECAVEGDDLSPLIEAAEGLLARAAGRLGLSRDGPPSGSAPGDAAAWAAAGAALAAERCGDWAAARDHARRAQELAPGAAAFAALAALYDAAHAAEGSDAFPPAEALPEEGLPPELASLASVLQAMGGGEEAAVERAFGTHLARHPRSARGYYLLGLWRLRGQERPGEAAIAFRHAFDVDPHYEPAARAYLRTVAPREPERVEPFLELVDERVEDEEKARRLGELARRLTGSDQ
jgi:hypothetical protein